MPPLGMGAGIPPRPLMMRGAGAGSKGCSRLGTPEPAAAVHFPFRNGAVRPPGRPAAPRQIRLGAALADQRQGARRRSVAVATAAASAEWARRMSSPGVRPPSHSERPGGPGASPRRRSCSRHSRSWRSRSATSAFTLVETRLNRMRGRAAAREALAGFVAALAHPHAEHPSLAPADEPGIRISAGGSRLAVGLPAAREPRPARSPPDDLVQHRTDRLDAALRNDPGPVCSRSFPAPRRARPPPRGRRSGSTRSRHWRPPRRRSSWS